MKRVALTLVVTTAAVGFAFRPAVAAHAAFWVSLTAAYLALSGLALYKMWDEGTLLELLKPRGGDISIGVILAAALLLLSWAVRLVVAPAGSIRQAWLFRIYLQIGDSEAIKRSALLTVLILVIAACEELVWRGMVLTLLAERVGVRRAWPLAALVYSASLIPTAFGLADPAAGPNPLLLIAGLGCGLVWSFAAAKLGRLMPVIFSHMVFSYFSAVQFRWPGG